VHYEIGDHGGPAAPGDEPRRLQSSIKFVSITAVLAMKIPAMFYATLDSSLAGKKVQMGLGG
jgi:hypothetical protein